MSFTGVHTAIENRFKTEWNGATQIAWANVAFTPPTNTNWVRCTVLEGDANQMSYGAGDKGLHRSAGVIVIECYTPANKAGAAARTLADNAAAIFRAVEFSGIVCRSPSIRPVGVSGAYYQVNVSVPFHADAIYA